jgi:hypothetical protein
MIEKFEDLGFKGEETEEQIAQIFQEKLGVGVPEMVELLSKYLKEHAEEIAPNFVTLIPYEDYSKLLEGDGKIAAFLKQDACKSDNWSPTHIGVSKDPKKPQMLEILFGNQAVNDGNSLTGYIFITFAGKILHVFVQGDP